MAPDMSAARAPAGDVVGAILEIDSMLKKVNGTARAEDSDLGFPLVGSATEASDLLDGLCTLLELFVTAFRQACEVAAQDVLAETVPYVIDRLRGMRRGVQPEAIPAMAGLMTAAALGLSPSLWRASYGPWRREELPALERAVLVLAQEYNRAHHSEDAALRMVMDSVESADGGPAA
jgi:hypothetical protein